jgi:hypothetical protein
MVAAAQEIGLGEQPQVEGNKRFHSLDLEFT